MAGSVGDVADEARVGAGQRQDPSGDLDVGHLVAAADVVDLACDAALQRGPDALAVIRDVDPVTDLHTVAVDRQRLAVQRVRHEEGDELLGILTRAERVAAPCDDRVDPVGVMPREHLQIAARLARRVRAGRLQRIGFAERPGVDRAVDLVGRDLHEPFDAGLTSCGQEGGGALHVRADELAGIQDAAIDVALSREVDDGVATLDGLGDDDRVGDVPLDEAVSRLVGHLGDVGRVAGVRQLVQVDHLGSPAQRDPNERRSDEPTPTSDEQPHADSLR